jgi:vacuolar-type H+-ATPase subunit C/Vma6
VSDAAELTLALRETPYRDAVGTAGATPGALELAVTRSLAERMALLAKWAVSDVGVLGPVFIEQDMRNVRDILRGIVGALTPEERTAGAIPTPSLGWKELSALARLESPAELAAKLVAWRHPLGSALVDEAAASRPDLFRLEIALARKSAEIAALGARRGGERMREFVREGIDAHNAVTALLLVTARAEGESAEFFVEGGASLSREELARAASAADRASALETLTTASRGTALARALEEGPARPASLSDRILTARIAAYRKRARREPLTAVPVLLFVLRLQREARAVRRALWATAL